MKISSIHRQKTGFFSQQQLDMVYNQELYSEFLTQPFSLEALEQQMTLKKEHFSKAARNLLVDTLKKQYSNIAKSQNVLNNIESLKNDNTYTIVTGHQLVAFTGPLYFIYKIAHVVKMCQLLNEKYSGSHVVPVFWMATEDHDYDEIKSFHIFNKTLTWETEQSGPVGRFEMKDWEPVLEQFRELYKNHPDSELMQLVNQFSGENYASAFRIFINALVEDFGVVIVDGDDQDFKTALVPYMQKDISEQFSYRAITSRTEKLVNRGAKQQIIPREINLFYMETGVRERLDVQGDLVSIKGEGTFSRSEMCDWVAREPQSFSPNVSLRPLYQEVLLPNLCYVGGAGEINYWLQLKEVFDQANVPFPLIQTRNSVMYIDKGTAEKMEKVNLQEEDLFKPTHILTKEYLASNDGEVLDFSNIDNQFQQLKSQILSATMSVDVAMESYAQAESVRMEKQVEQIKDRLFKTVKSKHDKNLKSIQQIKERLFPADGLQERYTNFFQLCPDGNFKTTLVDIVNQVEPFNGDLIIMYE